MNPKRERLKQHAMTDEKKKSQTKQNKTKGKLETGLVMAQLAQGKRETEGGGGEGEGEGRTARRHFFHSCSLLSHFTQTNCLIPLFGN